MVPACCKSPQLQSLHCPSNCFIFTCLIFITTTTLSLSCISCHPSTLSHISSFNFPLYTLPHMYTSSANAQHSPPLQFLHILSSLFKPCHLHVSTANSAAPPLNFTNPFLLVLPFTIILQPSHSLSISLDPTCFC